ncbi:TniQ family protein [Paenibacillus tritici]|uniref:TniQ family protein n=1 Tax=Paenibacillus tritici TaxID=1873425 RepID=UPI001BA84181|nr:TniQ family protein [Paenibacillus tritici]QUL57043.1 TniQ family protein [Paenibacillus tritici]
MIGSLILHPKPFHDESLKGYIIRLANLNLCPDPNRIYKMAGLFKSNSVVNVNMVKEKVNLARLSAMTTCSEDQLVSLSFYNEFGKSGKNSYNHKTQKMLRNGTCVYKQQICPHCLAEKGYHHKLWDVNIVTTCPTHLCLLIDECPQCGKKISAHRSNLMKCQCGYDFRKTQADKVPVEHTYLSNLINRKMFSLLPINSSIINPLADLELLDIIYLVMFFCEEKSRFYHGIKRMQFVRNAVLHGFIQDTMNIFEKWPTSFYEFLADMTEYKSTEKGKHEHASFYAFNTRLYTCLRDPEFLFIYQEYINYYEQNDSIYFKVRFKETLEKKLIQQKPLVIKSNHLNDLKYCTTKEVMNLLGIRRQVQVASLKESKMIKTVKDANLKIRYNLFF